jgi:type IV pilus assembly protein PilM
MFFKKHFTAVDIGTDSIKAVRFCSKKRELAIEGILMRNLPFETIKEGKIIDYGVISNRLEEIFRELNCRKDRIITTIPSTNLIIRNMELPVMEEKQLTEAIKWEAEDYLPYSVESATMDFKILSKQDETLQLLLVATKSDIIENIMSVFERLNLSPAVINVQPMALLSLLDYQQELDSAVAIVDIGASGTRVVIGDRNNIFLSRSIDIGGYEFTRIIMEEKKMNYTDAETYKRQTGIQEEEKIDYDIDNTISQIISSGMDDPDFLLTVARNLADEINRSLDYYSMKNRKKIGKVFITGGGSKLRRLNSLIENIIERELHPLNPFKGLHIRENEQFRIEEFAVAVGLGISEVLPDEG